MNVDFSYSCYYHYRNPIAGTPGCSLKHTSNKEGTCLQHMRQLQGSSMSFLRTRLYTTCTVDHLYPDDCELGKWAESRKSTLPKPDAPFRTPGGSKRPENPRELVRLGVWSSRPKPRSNKNERYIFLQVGSRAAGLQSELVGRGWLNEYPLQISLPTKNSSTKHRP